MRSLTITFLTVLIIATACEEKSKHELPDPLEAGWNGMQVCEVLSEDEKLRVLKCTFPPGVGHEKHYHAPHVGYSIKGSLFKIEDASGTREVNVPSDYHFENREVVIHEVQNMGQDTAVFLIIEAK